MRPWVTVVALGAVAGCVTVPQMTAVDLDAHARRNMLEAQQKYGGRMLVVRGIVMQTTLTPRERTEVSGAHFGPAFSATTKEEQTPLVVLHPGSVLCYFEPADIGDAAKLKEGDTVAFECEVQSFKPMQQMAVSTLAGCRVYVK